MNHDPTSDAATASLEPPQSDAALPGDSTSTPDVDAVLAALRHPRRRYLLSALAERDSARSLTGLATDVVAREDDEPRENVTTEARERCRIALHHVHLPKLTALGIVDYDPDGEPTVQAADTDQVSAVLDGLGSELDTTPGTPLAQDGT